MKVFGDEQIMKIGYPLSRVKNHHTLHIEILK